MGNRKISREEGDRICEQVLELVRRLSEEAHDEGGVVYEIPPLDPTPQTPDSRWLDRAMKKDPVEAAREAAGRSMYLYDDD